MGNQESKPNQASDISHVSAKTDNLSKELNLLYRDKICFHRSAKEVDDIKDSVTEMVHAIVAELGRFDSMFSNCVVIPVGSAVEKSKIREPNEFDFLIKIYALSLVPSVRFERQCTDRPGYAHVIIDDQIDGQVARQWASMTTGGRLRSTDPISKTGLRDRYSFLLGKTIKSLQEKKMDTVVRSTGALQLLSSVKTYGPSCVCLSRWTPHQGYGGKLKALDVDIDTVPAIQATGFEKVVDPGEIHEQAIDTLKESEMFMVIPCGRASCKDGLCFRLTFTNSEMILYHKLSTHHRKCFKILKYIFCKYIEPEKSEQSVLFSYALKAFVFNHDKVCTGADETALGMCIKSLLQDVKVCLEQKQPLNDGSGVRIFLPSICLTTHNIYDKDLAELPLIKKETGIATMIKILQEIEKGTENININDLLEKSGVMGH